MSIPKARLGDSAAGICQHGGSPFAWTGTVTSSSPNVLVNGVGDGKLGDQVSTNCPSCTTCNIVSGSATVLSNNVGTTKLGDSVIGPSAATGQVTSGSPNVLAGG